MATPRRTDAQLTRRRPGLPPTCHPSRPHEARGLCQPCYIALRRAERADASRRYYRRTFDPQRNRAKRLRVFGLTPEQYADMLAGQGGGCAICAATADHTRNSGYPNLAVDHDHTTGEVRGLLCNQCNRGLGMLGEHLTSAANYLRRSV